MLEGRAREGKRKGSEESSDARREWWRSPSRSYSRKQWRCVRCAALSVVIVPLSKLLRNNGYCNHPPEGDQ
jgi:hypothetical protein